MDRYNFTQLKNILSDCTCHYSYDRQSKTTIKICDCIISFDIETSNTYYNETKFAFMYIWQIGILCNNQEQYFYGRTWGEFREFLQHLKMILVLNKKKKCFIWVHNLAFEFQFMRKEIEGIWEVFAGDLRKPYKGEINNIIFRDTLILSGMSLEKVAENLTSHTIKKLSGDLDYTLIRHSETELSKEELAYCEHDVKIVCYYIAEQKDIYETLSKIPLTNTGRVREYVKNACYFTSKDHKKSNKGKYLRYRNLMESLQLTLMEYKLFNRAFTGGFTHANAMYTKQVIENVHSIDFTSSYPAVMIAEKFPMSTPELLNIRTLDEYKKLNHLDYGYLLTIRFYDLISKIDFENYLSESKAIEKGDNLAINNGRIFSANMATFIITDIDLSIILDTYTFSKCEILLCYQYYMDYLPRPIIKSIVELYEKKTTLKGVEGKEVEYLLSKGMLNSVYGMCVTAIARDEQIYNNDTWQTKKGDMQKQIEDYNASKTRFLYYPWGVYVTAYARRNLWKGILEFKTDYIYSDTDSIKCINYEKHKKWIADYNKDITEKILKSIKYNALEYKTPKTIKGIKKPIGVWDYEGKYCRFKTLGAKRYMYEEGGKLYITVAGLSKSQGRDYIAKQKNPFDFFNDNMYIPKEATSKLTHSYIDDLLECDIIDYKGKKIHVVSKSSIHLEKCDFTLSLSDSYKNFLRMLEHGYLLQGLTYDLI